MDWTGPLYITSVEPGKAFVTPKAAVRGARGLLREKLGLSQVGVHCKSILQS